MSFKTALTPAFLALLATSLFESTSYGGQDFGLHIQIGDLDAPSDIEFHFSLHCSTQRFSEPVKLGKVEVDKTDGSGSFYVSPKKLGSAVRKLARKYNCNRRNVVLVVRGEDDDLIFDDDLGLLVSTPLFPFVGEREYIRMRFTVVEPGPSNHMNAPVAYYEHRSSAFLRVLSGRSHAEILNFMQRQWKLVLQRTKLLENDTENPSKAHLWFHYLPAKGNLELPDYENLILRARLVATPVRFPEDAREWSVGKTKPFRLATLGQFGSPTMRLDIKKINKRIKESTATWGEEVQFNLVVDWQEPPAHGSVHSDETASWFRDTVSISEIWEKNYNCFGRTCFPMELPITELEETIQARDQ